MDSAAHIFALKSPQLQILSLVEPRSLFNVVCTLHNNDCQDQKQTEIMGSRSVRFLCLKPQYRNQITWQI